MRKKLIVALLACLLVVGLTAPAGAASVEGPVMGDAALTDGAVTVTLRLQGRQWRHKRLFGATL